MTRLFVSSLWVLLPSVLSAQTPAASFEQLSAQQRIEQGDSLTITDSTGKRTKGRLVILSTSTLSVNADGRPMQFSQGDVRRIQRGDSLANGALIGLGVGVGSAVATSYALCGSNDNECSTIVGIVIGVPVVIGSTVVGLIADAMTRKTVFQTPAAGTITWQVGPLWSPDSAGVGFALRF